MTYDYPQLAADIINNLPTGTTPADARRALQELDVLDQTAALAVSGGSEGGGSQVVQTATVTLDNTAILALPTTGIEIVPAVADSLLLILGMAAVLDNTAGVYSNVNADAGIAIHYGPSGDKASTLGDAGWLLTDGTSVGVFTAITFAATATDTTGVIRAQSDYASALVGQRLEVRAENSGDFEDGNPANTLRVTAIYTTVSVP